MRIDKLRIPSDRNLQNLEINFDEAVPITVLLGRNGSGKSNLIEDIVEIFLALESAAPVERFAYEIQYFCHGHKIRVEADPSREKERIKFVVNDKSISIAAFKRGLHQYLPKYVFAYYSGWNDRLEKVFTAPTRRYYQKNLETKDSEAVRRFFFCRKDYANLALLALFFEEHALAKYIREKLLRIESFDSALFVLKAPYWAKSSDNSRPEGNDFFWGARGNFSDFMDRLRAASLAPIRNIELTESDVRGRSQSSERLYLYLKDRESLDKIRLPYETPKLLFNHLESMYLSDLIEEIRVVGRRSDGSLVRFDQLSEGEQQLVAVFGLLLFTQSDESLYLLDEPDSHLNPRWTYEYRSMLSRALFPSVPEDEKALIDENPIDTRVLPTAVGNSQVLIATHNPLMISAHPRTHVRILDRTPQGTTALPPEDEPPSMSIDRLLTSDVFGLETAMPKSILQRLSRREELAAMSKRTVEEDEELAKLSGQLEEAGLMRTYRLPEEKEFIDAMRRRELRSTVGMTPAEVAERNARADALLDEIFSSKT
ncbi:ATP-binding protein [Acidovorax sp.]|uniref:AAA family ATPase n=1 Tax=Acidovorax sp. TaxID=1872122 RepID=UPI0026079F00|nr:ATP-binding protein [Acidovorax sp.]